MKATHIIQLASLYGGETTKRAEAVATQLRQMGHLPKGGRGPYAPNINAVEAANYLLCAAAAGRALRVEDVPGMVTNLIELVDAEGVPLLKFIGAVLSSAHLAHSVQCLRVFPHMPMVEIEWRDGQKAKRFFLPALWATNGFTPEAQGEAYVGTVGHIGGGVIAQAALDLEQSADNEGEIVPE